jgi:hypothetical protein
LSKGRREITEENRGKKKKKSLRMAEPLTNVIFALILHLIWSTAPAHGTIAAKSIRIVIARATVATVWRTLHPKIKSTTAPTVPAHGTIVAKSIRAVVARATAATVWRTLHPKITN